jgi:hypothetical protein
MSASTAVTTAPPLAGRHTELRAARELIRRRPREVSVRV